MIHQIFWETIYIPPGTQLVLFLAPSDHLVVFCLCNHLNSFRQRSSATSDIRSSPASSQRHQTCPSDLKTNGIKYCISLVPAKYWHLSRVCTYRPSQSTTSQFQVKFTTPQLWDALFLACASCDCWHTSLHLQETPSDSQTHLHPLIVSFSMTGK